MITNPKFEKHISDRIAQNENERQSLPRYGIISEYDSLTNTATVILSSPDSDQLGDIITRVQCPTYNGLQMSAPEPGQPCWVVFQGAKNDSRPVITHYFHFNYRGRNWYRQTMARSGVPQFLLSM